MLWRDYAPLSPRFLFLFITVVYLLAVAAILLLTISGVAKILLLITASCYFLIVLYKHIFRPQPSVTILSDDEFLVTIARGSFVACLQQDSIMLSQLMLLRFSLVNSRRCVVMLFWRHK